MTCLLLFFSFIAEEIAKHAINKKKPPSPIPKKQKPIIFIVSFLNLSPNFASKTPTKTISNVIPKPKKRRKSFNFIRLGEKLKDLLFFL